MNQLKSEYYVKPNSISPPKLYLGAEIKKTNDRCGKPAWVSSSNKYVKEAINVVDSRMNDLNIAFTKSAKHPMNPFSNVKYRPEMDISEYCTDTKHQLYQQYIGILRWMTELGCIDICTEVSLLSRYLAQSCLGHLAADTDYI